MIQHFSNWIESIWRDLRFVLRSLAKTPGFTATAIVVLAVGIGANTAIFSVVNTILLKPLSYPEPESLVQLMDVSPEGKFDDANVPKFNVWHQQTEIFQFVAAYDRGVALLNLTGGDNPEQVPGVHVTADYFSLFGARVVAGRTFTAAEDSSNGGHVVVLSYGLWKRRFGGNPNVVGTNIQLEGQPYLVVGVIGQEFVTKAGGDLWLPYQFDLNSQDLANYFVVAARLKPGITLQMANAQMKLAMDEYRRTYPKFLSPESSFGVIPLQESIVGDTRSSLLVLLGAVGFVLLIACANVGNLLLIRASGRKRELATRAALGAGRAQIIRQLLTESLVLSLTGGILGLFLGIVGVRMLLAISPGDIPRIGENGSAVTLDLNVLFFTFATSAITGVVFGLVPAISASRPNLAATLNESSNRSGVGFRSGRIRSVLVVSEMALALILVVGAALLIRTFRNLQAVDPGFDTHDVLTMAMSINADRFQKTAGVAQIVRDGTSVSPGCLASPALPPPAAFRCRAALACLLTSLAAQRGTTLPQAEPVSSRCRGATSIHSKFRSCADEILPSMMTARLPELSSSTRRWRRNTGPRVIRCRTACSSASAWVLFLRSPRARSSASPATWALTASIRIPLPLCTSRSCRCPTRVTALNSRVAPLWWIVRSRRGAAHAGQADGRRIARRHRRSPGGSRPDDE